MKKNVQRLVCLTTMLMVAMPMTAYAKPIDLATSEEASAPGSLRGRIVDQNGETLPGATISIEKEHIGVISDINGFYNLANLKPGTYEVMVSYVGYKSQIMQITIEEGATIEKNIVLRQGTELNEVVVTGPFQGQVKAINLQKNAMGVSNVISSDQVGKFPDANIGDALKRVNGVNVQYDQGEARFGQVRGTSADLTSVTVNGNRVPSAEGDTRNVQLDLIPADMIQTIELNKVVTSDMDGDAIGGAINLVTKNTPYNRVLNFTLGSGFGMVSGKPQGTFGATYGDRFFNNKLGVMASISYQYSPNGSDNTEFEYEIKDDQVRLKEAQLRQYYVTRQRQSYSLALDYKFNPNHQITFKSIYNLRHDWENRYRISYKKLSSGASKQSIVLQTKAGSEDENNARLELQQTADFNLGGEHHFGRLKMDWLLNYARATEERPNERYAAVKFSGPDFGGNFEQVGQQQPYCTLDVPSFSESGWKISELTNSNQTITENEYKARINFELPMNTGLYANKLRFGAKYVNKNKNREKSTYSYEDAVLGDWQNHLSTQVRDGFMCGSNYPIGTQFISREWLGGIDFSKENGTEVLEYAAGNYDANEQISSAYIRFDQKLGNSLDMVAGLRVERTDLTTSGVNYIMDENENERLESTGEYKNNYTNLLPSLLLKYKFNKDGNLRASVTKTISRPKYSALIANKSYNLSDLTAVIGDPETKPTSSYNFDLSADYYFQSIGLVSAGAFYKNIKDVNVETLGYYKGEEIGLTGNTETFTVTQNMNAYDAKVFGLEFAYQRDFSFLAESLKCLGFYGTYTYTHSTTSNYNSRLGIKDSDNIKMAGSPEHTANASLYFEKNGINVRMSYNFASAFVDQMNLGSRELDRYYDNVNYLDLNASYSWGKKAKYTVYAEATNLLNQPLRYYQGEKERTMQVEYYGMRINAGIKINL